jgi:hypothetical protein
MERCNIRGIQASRSTSTTFFVAFAIHCIYNSYYKERALKLEPSFNMDFKDEIARKKTKHFFASNIAFPMFNLLSR